MHSKNFENAVTKVLRGLNSELNAEEKRYVQELQVDNNPSQHDGNGTVKEKH